LDWIATAFVDDLLITGTDAAFEAQGLSPAIEVGRSYI